MADLRTKLRALPVLKGSSGSIDFSVFPETPQKAFEMWLEEAIEAGVQEPHAMTLSTIDEHNRPDARVLILKDVDSRGWQFAFNANSAKGQQIAGNQQVALTFYWPLVARQVRIRGTATALPEAERMRDTMARPLMSRVLAMASKQSQPGMDAEELAKRMDDARLALESGSVSELPELVLYAVVPETVEFWQGSTDRVHQRLRYVSSAAGWEKELLWP